MTTRHHGGDQPKKLNGPNNNNNNNDNNNNNNNNKPIEKVFDFANTSCDTPQGTAVGPRTLSSWSAATGQRIPLIRS